MAHKRIRPFNTKDTYPEQKLDNDLSQGVVARGTMVFLRGQCPQELDDARSLDSHDPAEHTEPDQLVAGAEILCDVVLGLADPETSAKGAP